MRNQQKWQLAISQFNGYYANIPPWLKAEQIEEYHSLVSALEEASEEDLSNFKIPADKIKPKVVSVPSDFSGYLGSTQYSREGYCDSIFFKSKIDGLKVYLSSLEQGPHRPSKYDGLSDLELDDLMISRHIKPDMTGKPIRKPTREYIIAALVKQDAPQTPIHSTTYNVFDSNFIQSSPGASITQTTVLKSEELRKIVNDLKRISSTQQCSRDNQAQINVDIGTIELQISSKCPNHSIINASLESAKAIVENAAGAVLGEGVVVAIKHYLKLP